MKPLIVILGPTASGKSSLAINLAKKYQGEIICADSRTIYKGLKIGTASPISQISNLKSQISKWGRVYIINDIPHHLLHFVSSIEVFTVAQFQKMAYEIIDDILGHGKIPFLVGGTGLYIDTVTKGLKIPRVAPNFALREKLEKLSNKQLTAKLKMLDRPTAEKIDTKNKRRLIRALEVCTVTGQPFSKFQKSKKPKYNILKIGIKLPQEKLNKRIDERVDLMIKTGLVEEIKKLMDEGCRLNTPAMSGLGYKQIADYYINKNKTLGDVILDIKLKTRQYAKRQMTWFRRDKETVWIKDKKEAENKIKNFLSKKPKRV